jgi:large subunit ribosomal protein L29
MSKAHKTLSAHRERTAADLEKVLAERQKELFEVRMSAYTDQERSPAQMRAIRRDIARIKTVIGEKNRAQEA